MSDETKPAVGSVGWIDLTVPDAPRLRDFYATVVGLRPDEVDMGEYADFNMLDASGAPAAGVCHARGPNEGLPAHWLVYFVVDNCEASCARCVDLGGEVVLGPKAMGRASYAVVRDPAGAYCALYRP